MWKKHCDKCDTILYTCTEFDKALDINFFNKCLNPDCPSNKPQETMQDKLLEWAKQWEFADSPDVVRLRQTIISAYKQLAGMEAKK